MEKTKPTRVIKNSKILSFEDIKELWRYRELLLSLTERNIKVRYRQTIIGGLWAVAQPVVAMVVFTMLFGQIAHVPSDGIPYPIFSYTGLILWLYFSNTLNSASNSLVAESTMISKVYFPRMMVPLASVLTGLVDYVVSGLVLVGLMVYYKIGFGVQLIFLPVVLLITMILVSGVGFWLSSLNVKYRDIRFIVPFFLQMLLFLTPVIYPVSLAEKYADWLKWNPLSGLIGAHRVILLGHKSIDWQDLGISALIIGVIFLSGLIYFKRVERYFADII